MLNNLTKKIGDYYNTFAEKYIENKEGVLFYKISKNINSYGKIYASERFAKENNLTENTQIVLYIGLRNFNVEFVISHKIPQDEIEISKNILDQALIPIDIRYQVKCDKNNIIIGPVIGLLFSKTHNNLTNDVSYIKHKEGLAYCEDSGFSTTTAIAYPGIKGLLYVFSAEGVNFKNNTIKGYYYNENYDNPDDMWKEGIFPMPSVIYKRLYMWDDKHRVRAKLSKLTGNKLFDSYWRTKWSFWKQASKYPEIKEHLPHTEVFRSFDKLEEMLDRFGIVFIKLFDDCLANGLIKIRKTGNQYSIQQPFEKGEKFIEGTEQAEKYMMGILKNRYYLLQQGVNTIKYKDGCSSLRIIMQKDESFNWKLVGICPRVGVSGGICSNYKPEIYTLTFESFMKETLNLRDEEISAKKQEVIDLCFKLCNMTDDIVGRFADMGIDIGIDEKMNIWVFEINDGHHHHVPLKVSDKKMYYEVKKNVLRYACALSGFNYYGNKVNDLED